MNYVNQIQYTSFSEISNQKQGANQIKIRKKNPPILPIFSQKVTTNHIPT